MVATDGRRGFFEREGYLVVEDLLTRQEVAACEAEVARLHERARELKAALDPDARCFQREPFARDELLRSADGLPVLRKVEETRRFSQVLADLARHRRLIPIVQELIGSPDLLLFRSTLMLKPAFHGSAHGLHQDSAYWPMDPPTLVTVSLALSDATADNGCIRVIPGSHTWGLQAWGDIARDRDRPLTDRTDLDTSGQVEVPLRAGSALLFHSLTVHGSGPNDSPRPRHTALYAYFPPTVRYRPKAGRPQAATFPVVAGLEGRQEVTLVAEAAPAA